MHLGGSRAPDSRQAAVGGPCCPAGAQQVPSRCPGGHRRQGCPLLRHRRKVGAAAALALLLQLRKHRTRQIAPSRAGRGAVRSRRRRRLQGEGQRQPPGAAEACAMQPACRSASALFSTSSCQTGEWQAGTLTFAALAAPPRERRLFLFRGDSCHCVKASGMGGGSHDSECGTAGVPASLPRMQVRRLGGAGCMGLQADRGLGWAGGWAVRRRGKGGCSSRLFICQEG